MVAEIYAGLSAFKAMFDMAKGLKDINDAAIRNTAVIELQEKIRTAQEAQTTLLERIDFLEKELVRFEKWETEKENYKLVEVGPGAFARVIKPAMQGSEPECLFCPTCYEQAKKSVLQALPQFEKRATGADTRVCPVCSTRVAVARNPQWQAPIGRRW
jgi:hypothetical protein